MEVNGYQESEILYEKQNDTVTSANINVTDLDDETNTRLRGDAIGDTLYSQSFVLKTLLQFSDLKWSEEVEEDLCFLWDMTVEKDVCKYLFELSFPSLACSGLMKYTENRFIEIVIGILANILCADCDKCITGEEINIVLSELDTDDTLILIQIARFMSVIAHISEELSFITEDILDKIKFILCNSTNHDLLLKSLEVVVKLTTGYKLSQNFVDTELFNSNLTAYQTIIQNHDLDEFELDSRNKQLTCRYMLEVVSNICAYADLYESNELLSELKQQSRIFINEVVKILHFYSYEGNLLPITDDFIFYISVFKFVFKILNTSYLPELFVPLTNILYTISEIKEDVMELFESVLDLECFLLFQSTPEFVCQDLKCVPKFKVKKILKLVNEYKHTFDSKFNMQYLLDKYK